MKILLFTQYFPPETGAAPQRAYAHAKRWKEKGHEVRVITNIPNSPQGKFYKNYRNRIIQNEIVHGLLLGHRVAFGLGLGKSMPREQKQKEDKC